MLYSNAKALAPGRPPTRRASNRHRKQAKGHMGKFAQAAAQYDAEQRGDGMCVAGKWISENFDEDDVAEFTRLANDHRWRRIERQSEGNLKEASMIRHAHATCKCVDGVAARGCCACETTGEVA